MAVSKESKSTFTMRVQAPDRILPWEQIGLGTSHVRIRKASHKISARLFIFSGEEKEKTTTVITVFLIKGRDMSSKCGHWSACAQNWMTAYLSDPVGTGIGWFVHPER
jgi:hypothetical protein